MGLVMTDDDGPVQTVMLPLTYICKGPNKTDFLCFFERAGDIPDMTKAIMVCRVPDGVDNIIQWADNLVRYGKTIKARRALIKRG